MRHLNNGTDHRHSKSCCDQSSPARRTIMPKKIWDFREIKINTRGIYKAKRVHIYELRVYRKVIFVDYLSHRLIWFQYYCGP